MVDIQNDVRFIKEALPELKDYLLANQLYWPLPGLHRSGQVFSDLRVTPGNLLISRFRLMYWPFSVGQERYLKELDELRNLWRSHWLRKVDLEIPARISLWSEFLQESEAGESHQTSYNYQVRSRFILKLLFEEDPSMALIYQERMEVLDRQLEEISGKGPFVWEPELQGVCPEADYPYLYRLIHPKKEND